MSLGGLQDRGKITPRREDKGAPVDLHSQGARTVKDWADWADTHNMVTERAGMWHDGTQVQYPICKRMHIGGKPLEEIQCTGITTANPNVWISSYNDLSRVKNNQDNMTAYLSKMWHMKKVKELASKNNIEGLRYVKTLTFKKDESIIQYSYSNVLLEIGHPGYGFSLCLRLKGFLICRGHA